MQVKACQFLPFVIIVIDKGITYANNLKLNCTQKRVKKSKG